MRPQVLIVGGGRVGRHTAEGLAPARYQVRIVERDGEKCEALARNCAAEVVHGDGTNRDILEAAGIEEADIVSALTNDTTTNRTVAELAYEYNPNVRTLVRIAHDGQQDLGYLQFVDNVVYPAAAGATVAVESITSV